MDKYAEAARRYRIVKLTLEAFLIIWLLWGCIVTFTAFQPHMMRDTLMETHFIVFFAVIAVATALRIGVTENLLDVLYSQYVDAQTLAAA